MKGQNPKNRRPMKPSISSTPSRTGLFETTGTHRRDLNVPPPSSDLIRDSGSLQRLIRSIYVQRDDIDRNHREATVEFLKYIADLGHKTERYLHNFASSPPDPDPDLAAIDRGNLATLRNFWFDLHEFVQPSRDADTLHSPAVLISQLEEQLSTIPRLGGCKLLISHTAELNYVQSSRQELKERAESYVGIVPGSPRFPQKMALIAIPYSQDESLFSNLIICHEIGHFVFEQLHLERQLFPRIKGVLNTLSGTDLSWCLQRVWAWAEEIFCDRFAIGLVGPAFSFSYIEMFDVLGLADDDKINDFTDTHPSDSCRFFEHSEQLKRTGWWSLLDQRDSSYTALIRKLANVSSTDYTFYSEDNKSSLEKRALKAFLKIQRFVGLLVSRVFQGAESRFHGGEQAVCVEAIEKYLSWGVVPATLIRNKKAFSPDPVLLINAAYCFYLEGIPTLISRINQSRREQSQYVSQREKWSQRVEQWTIKALEDLRLPTKRKPWPA
jgi:hypothetical protein